MNIIQTKKEEERERVNIRE